MVVVAHDGIGTKINRKYGTKQLNAIYDPLTTVFEVKACEWISPTQESTPHTAGDAMVIRCVFDGDLAVSWFWHKVSSDRWRDGHHGKS